MNRHYTHNSTYEVDTEAKRVRRLAGVNPPVAPFEDGVWVDYAALQWYYGALLFTFPGIPQTHVRTSLVLHSERITSDDPEGSNSHSQR